VLYQCRKTQIYNLIDFRASSANNEIKDFWFVGTELFSHILMNLLFQKRCKYIAIFLSGKNY